MYRLNARKPPMKDDGSSPGTSGNSAQPVLNVGPAKYFKPDPYKQDMSTVSGLIVNKST